MRNTNGANGLSTICRSIDAGIQNVDGIFRLRIGVDARVIEGALTQPAIVVDDFPGLTGVVGDEHAAVGGLDDRIDPVRVSRGNRDADFSPHWFRQAVVSTEFLPGRSSIGRLEDSASTAATRK